MKKIIKKNLGQIYLVTGIILFVYNILNWDYKLVNKLILKHISSGGGSDMWREIVCYYPNDTKILIILGILLILLGIFKIKNK